MKQKQLESYLSRLETFTDPDVTLEQYATSAEIAASMLVYIDSHDGGLADKLVVDLGCGTGTLSIGAALLGTSHCVGIDVDEKALEIATENINEMELSNIELVKCDVRNLNDMMPSTASSYMFDVVVMNPPFGTKNNQGIDMEFVTQALRLAPTVYSMHKTSTRKFILKRAERLNCKAEAFAKLKFDLPQTYKFHKQKSIDIEVDLIKFSNKS